jgi:uncharacterized protein YkwD
LIACCAVALAPSTPPASAAAACPHASAAPGAATAEQLRHATLCLLNRARHDAPRLVANHDLTRMARHHDMKMVGQDCFQHRCQGEPRLQKRLKRSGYLDGAQSWRYAEEIGYENTPAQMVAAWLAHANESADLLSAKYTDVGIGIKSGVPEAGVDGSKFATYVIDLASRKPAP